MHSINNFKWPDWNKMKILIVGAGIAGLSLWHKLKNSGHEIDIIEKADHHEEKGTGICLPAHAVRQLANMGLKEQILACAHKVQEVRFETSQRKLLASASLLEEPLNFQPFIALRRSELIDVLLEQAKTSIKYSTTVKEISDNSSVTFNTGEVKTYDLIVAADGINSQIRHQVFEHPDLLDLSVTNWRFCITAKNHGMQPSYLLGNNEVFMFYPISNDEIYCYGQISDPKKYWYSLDEKTALKQVFAHYHKSVLQAINDSQHIVAGRLKSVQSREVYKNNCVLIGDALHGCPPSLQQGVNMALEDVSVLAKVLCKPQSVDNMLGEYKRLRLDRIDWVINESNKTIKLAELGKYKIGRFIRNSIVKLTGPTNVHAWKKLI